MAGITPEVDPDRAPQPELPGGGEKWPARTREWWATWDSAPQAVHFTATDWEFLLETALLHAKFWAGDTSVSGELRQRVAKFGATPQSSATLYEAVALEHQELTPELRSAPAAVLVRKLAADLDAAREASAVSTLSKEFRAASDALREVVLQAGERGDAVDDLAKQRAARRGAGAADPGSAGQRGKQRPGGG